MGLPGDKDGRMNLRRTALTVVLGSLCAAAGSGVAAQDDPVKWSAKVVTKSIRPGGAFDVAVTVAAFTFLTLRLLPLVKDDDNETADKKD